MSVPNRLAGETSPYLLQHATNPVDWYPWGPEALAKARAERKPILLSIGYSACHWCHVMAHESFEDQATAALMNALFVNIKVDREERPDLDRIQQLAHQLLTQRSGGWPLTMFLTPDDQTPFFGGTYFPKEPRYGMPAFGELLQRVARYYREQGADIRAQNAALVQAFNDIAPPPADRGLALDDLPLRQARRQLEASFDRHLGGFGDAPKFPSASTLERLLRDWHATAGDTEPDLQALYMAALTLTRMAEGGLYDQLGGGFCRYSVDAQWMIPHFEKMLYDNGTLLAAYAQAAVATGETLFTRIAGETADWMIRDLQLPEGGFASSFDADSEGHEGRFYVWTREEVRAALPPDQHALFATRYGLDREPNFEDRSWHLHVFRPLEEIAAEAGIGPEEATQRLDTARTTLLQRRNRRVWPARDDKALTGWNALAIRGLARAARALRRPDLAAAATRALDFVRTQLWRDGRLLATARDGRAQLPAYLDDYAFLADAVLELAQARWRDGELEFARELLEVLLAHFEDREGGGFFFTADDHETLFHRSKGFSDEATPSGNGVVASVLQRLGYLLGEPRWLAAAEHGLQAAWPALQKWPHAHTTLLTALEEYLHPPQTVILRGEPAAIAHWHEQIDRLYAPRRLLLAIPSDATGLPAALAAKPAPTTRGVAAVAYLCEGHSCSAPIDSLPELVQRLRLQLDDAAGGKS
ncbi:MAG: thioredoxin domain-containing protein [Steroidobacteraceae bacterium]|nr:thioredoxin domain-containing protein [Nevskiaceae bacterium]MCP5339420.1 thioredoxin domain-containing protein [Nevskiaceae bacterium]MCP5360530.1 thioredoxin domain-containing protein [Nevskiaceae bacterium]MCP5472876.1 thioredoxin domain-containing protein [Nevskiaceae bacterium]